MRRIAPVLVALALSLSSEAAPIQTPCDVLPPSVEPALCQPCPGGPPVPGGQVGGNGLDYVDKWHAQCEVYRNGRGIDQCKRDTTCLPGWEKFQDGGVWKCRQPATAQKKDDCERRLPLAISRVTNDQGLANPTVYTGHDYLFIWGGGAANATTADMAGGINVTLGEAARRVGNNAVCPPPDCQVAKLEVPASAAGAPRRLTLYTPHRYKSATYDLFVSLPPTPAPAPMRAGLGSAGTVGGQPHPNLAASPTPTPRPPTQQQYTAGLTCPGTLSSFQNSPTPVFEIRGAQVQATVSSRWWNTKSAGGVPACVWTDAYALKITALDGQGDVTVSWTPQVANNYANPVDASNVQTITLTRGRWQIVPDATTPPDFTYTISFRD